MTSVYVGSSFSLRNMRRGNFFLSSDRYFNVKRISIFLKLKPVIKKEFMSRGEFL